MCRLICTFCFWHTELDFFSYGMSQYEIESINDYNNMANKPKL